LPLSVADMATADPMLGGEALFSGKLGKSTAEKPRRWKNSWRMAFPTLDTSISVLKAMSDI